MTIFLRAQPRYDMAIDMWSFGCIMAFYLNKGKHLFQVTSIPEMIQKMRSWVGLPPGTIKGFSRDLVALIERMLHPNPKKRPSAKQIRAETRTHRDKFDKDFKEQFIWFSREELERANIKWPHIKDEL